MNASRFLDPRKYVAYAEDRLVRARRALTSFTRDLPGTSTSYAQHGEDLLLSQLLAGVARGFYVDVGAYDPGHFNNTKYFSRRGWTGINIEPVPARHRRFVRARPRDVNLNIGIAETPGRALLYCIEPDTLTTFVKEEAERYAALPRHRVVATLEIPVLPLSAVLDQYARDRRIDFISIDVEGLEHSVLRSNDWRRHRPCVVLIESVQYQLEPAAERLSTNAEWEHVLTGNGYARVGDTAVNSFYVDLSNQEIMSRAQRLWPGRIHGHA